MQVMDALEEEDIETRPIWKPMPSVPEAVKLLDKNDAIRHNEHCSY